MFVFNKLWGFWPFRNSAAQAAPARAAPTASRMPDVRFADVRLASLGLPPDSSCGQGSRDGFLPRGRP